MSTVDRMTLRLRSSSSATSEACTPMGTGRSGHPRFGFIASASVHTGLSVVPMMESFRATGSLISRRVPFPRVTRTSSGGSSVSPAGVGEDASCQREHPVTVRIARSTSA